MIQKLGGGRVLDYGPSAAIHSRGRVPGGVMVGQGMSPMVKLKGLGNGPTGTGGTLVPTVRDKPEQAAERKAIARERYAVFMAKHTDCNCHEMYGNQPRPVGYRERERDRAALRREMRA